MTADGNVANAQGRSTISMIGRINMALAVTWPAAASSGATPMRLEAPPVDTGEGVGERGAKAGDLTGRALSRHEQRWSDQHGDAAEADKQRAELEAVDPFVLREEMGNRPG